MKRRGAQIFAGFAAVVAAALSVGPLPAQAATIKVKTTADLQNAIQSAPAGSQIELAPGDYTPDAPLVIQRTLTISGPTTAPGARIAGSNVPWTQGNPPDVVIVKAGATVTIRSLALTGGDSQGTTLNVFGAASIENVEISGNNGSSVWAQPGARLTITNSTVSDNAGDGVIVDGAATIVSSTIANNDGAGIANRQGSATLQNTIVAENTRKDCLRAISQPATSLDSDRSCGANIHADPRLAPLANNGGPTSTHALGAGSPAIGAGAACGQDDQRFAPRSVPCDIGAFEHGAKAPSGTGVGSGSSGSSGSSSSSGSSGSSSQGTSSGSSTGSAQGTRQVTAVTARGTVSGLRGHTATFKLNLRLMEGTVTGTYVDRSARISLRILRVVSTVSDATKGRATLRGIAVNSVTGRSERFTIRLTDGRPDRFTIILASGYTGGGALKTGNVQLHA